MIDEQAILDAHDRGNNDYHAYHETMTHKAWKDGWLLRRARKLFDTEDEQEAYQAGYLGRLRYYA